ncbi:MAG: TolC family protein [Chitinophagaceae bacterium]|nr:TolC family protein [Chitinophagaceae bacterium]
MKSVFVLAVLCCSVFFGSAQDAPAKLSLKESVDIALKNNITVKQSGLLADADQVDWQQAKANVLPDLNANWNFGWNQGRNIDPATNGYINQQLSSSGLGLSSNVILFAGLQLHNSIKQTALAYQASKKDYDQAKNALTLNVLLTYLQILNNEDVLAISKSQIEVTRKQVERLQIMVREGAVGQYQLTDLQAQLSSDEITIVNSYNNLQTSKLTLSQLMNVPYNKDLQLDRSEFQEPAGVYEGTALEVYQQALQDFAQVQASNLRVQSFEKAVKVARGAYYPTLSFGANLGSRYSSADLRGIPGSSFATKTGQYIDINNVQYDVFRTDQNMTFTKIDYGKQIETNLGTFYGFQLQIPLFNNLRVRNQVKLSKIGLQSAELDNQNIKLVLRQNIDQAHLNMEGTFARFKALQEQVRNLEISFAAAEIRFNNGVINPAEYLLVKTNLDRANINLVTSMYEYHLRTKVLDYYRARLVW